MAKFGIRSVGGQQFAYSEGTSGESAAVGINTTNGHFHLVVQATPNATTSSTPIIDIESASNGNVLITPNGSGIVQVPTEVITTGLTLGYATQGVLQTDSLGVVTSSTGTDGQILINNTATGVASWANITPGANISVSNGANSITIAAAGATSFAYTGITDADSPYTVLVSDQVIGVDCSGAAVTVLLPNAPTTGSSWIIKDFTGSANTNNITLSTPGGVVLIDAAATYVMNSNYQSVQVVFNGTKYMVI